MAHNRSVFFCFKILRDERHFQNFLKRIHWSIDLSNLLPLTPSITRTVYNKFPRNYFPNTSVPIIKSSVFLLPSNTLPPPPLSPLNNLSRGPTNARGGGRGTSFFPGRLESRFDRVSLVCVCIYIYKSVLGIIPFLFRRADDRNGREREREKYVRREIMIRAITHYAKHARMAF